jgi:hypothetical protein
MFCLPNDAQIVFFSKPISQLNGIDGLSRVVQNEIGMEPDCGSYFLFCNSKRDRFKILYKEDDNLAVWFKRFSGTLHFQYTNQVIIFDKASFLEFLSTTHSKHHYTLKNIYENF